MTYNNPGTHGMPDKVESGCPLYYAALGHSYAQNCLVAASFSLPDPAAITWPVLHTLRKPHREKPPLPLTRHRISHRNRHHLLIFSIEDVAAVTSSLRSSSSSSSPRVTRGQMIYRTVVAAYKTVIMFYHPGRSTETRLTNSVQPLRAWYNE